MNLLFRAAGVALVMLPSPFAATMASATDRAINYADTERCSDIHMLWFVAGSAMKLSSTKDMDLATAWSLYGKYEFPDISEEEKKAAKDAAVAMRQEYDAIPRGGESRMLFLMPKLTECIELRTANIKKWLPYEDGSYRNKLKSKE